MSAPDLIFQWDSRDLMIWRSVGGRAGGTAVEKALARALRLAGNQAARSLERDEQGFALSKKRLPPNVIAEDQTRFFPGARADIRGFVWKLFIRGKPVPAAKFPHNMSGLGTIVTFGGDSGTRLIGSAFTATMKSGHRGIFKRTGTKRLPIEEVFSSRLPRRFGPDVMTTYGDKTYRKLETAFRRGLDRELGKLKRKGLA